MADRDPFLTVDKNRSEAFLSNGMDQQGSDDKHDMETTVQASDGS
jgi:hypothetical protein